MKITSTHFIIVIAVFTILYLTLQIGRWWGNTEKEQEWQGWIEEQYKMEAQPSSLYQLPINIMPTPSYYEPSLKIY